jgi:hypothetical protein
VVRYDGVPRTQVDLSVPEEPLPYGWIHTDDGAVVVSEPEGSANWFPSTTTRRTRRLSPSS